MAEYFFSVKYADRADLFASLSIWKEEKYRQIQGTFGDWKQDYELELTNFEVKVMFRTIIQSWFHASQTDYNDFVQALLQGGPEEMNAYMNRISETIFRSFDTVRKSSDRTEPERFYHGLVLGLMMDLKERYVITSNRESGFGRYDVQLELRQPEDDAILLEFIK